MKTLDQIQQELSELSEEVRKTNVRSLGLKVGIHERWCQRLASLNAALLDYMEKALIPPPPPGV